MAYLKVEGHEGLVRDTSSGGSIINTNKNSYEISKRRASEVNSENR